MFSRFCTTDPSILVRNGLNKARSRPLLLDALINDIEYAFLPTGSSVVDLRDSVQLNVWKSSLTDELDLAPRSLLTPTPHKLMLHLAYWWFMILLHRPFFGRKSRPIHSTDREIDHVKVSNISANLIGSNL